MSPAAPPDGEEPGRRFYRLSGGGNDFLALVEPDAPPAAEEIRALCRRGLSLGADGLFVLRRTASGARMDHFNPDGGASALCLNGTRCAALLTLRLGWAEGEAEILTGAGVVAARVAEAHQIQVSVAPPSEPVALEVEIDGRPHAGWKVLVGVPHFVLEWPETLGRAPVAELGPLLRRAPVLGPDGANVDFVRFARPGLAELRTYERGVEAETLACGTGAIATAAVGLAAGRGELPLAVQTQGGCCLTIAREGEDPDRRAWTLTGDARLVASGEITAAALELPLPPDWSP